MLIFPILVSSLIHGMHSHAFQLGSEAMVSPLPVAPACGFVVASSKAQACESVRKQRHRDSTEPVRVQKGSGSRLAERLLKIEVGCQVADEATIPEPLLALSVARSICPAERFLLSFFGDDATCGKQCRGSDDFACRIPPPWAPEPKQRNIFRAWAQDQQLRVMQADLQLSQQAAAGQQR